MKAAIFIVTSLITEIPTTNFFDDKKKKFNTSITSLIVAENTLEIEAMT